jgi:hypothetical protein
MRYFEAKYSGTCGRCEGRINVGDQVMYEDDVIVHIFCEETERPAREVCTSCFIEKPCECDD